MQSHQLRMTVGLLKLINSFGGKIDGRIRIQKAAYLLCLKGVPYFDPREFVYHHHGPYSRSLSDILHQAVSFGLVDEVGENFSGGITRYSYKITLDGENFISTSYLDSDKILLDFAKHIDGFGSRALELAATVAFLKERGEALDHHDALRRALQLKPACQEYRDAAERALEKVGFAA